MTTKIFKPEFYEGIRERVNNLSGVEKALKLIKNDEKLQEILGRYVAISEPSHLPQNLDLYRKKYKIPPKKKEGQIFEVGLSIPLKGKGEGGIPIEFTFDCRELYWWGNRCWLSENDSWAVFYGGPDTGAGWAARWQSYGIEEREVGFYLIPSQNSEGRLYDKKRICDVEPLKKVREKEIISNLKKRLRGL